MNKKQNTRGFSTQIRKIYVKEDNTLNRFALFLSGLAIALIVLLLINFKGFILANKSSASELSYSEAMEEIYDYIDSLNGFTDEQRSALDSIINNYLAEKNVITEDDMNMVHSLIDAKYQSNREYLQETKLQLEAELNAASSKDLAHYDELTRLIDELNNLLSSNESADASNKASFTQAINDLKSYSEQNKSSIQTLDNDYRNDSDKIWEQIKILQNRTSDLHDEKMYEFDFRYENGCYGYYADGEGFKPF
ncbi:hypothetical protein [Pseudobutyrivibrio xylanivorans]|uniref:Uncharacterized protein n=1 Tax=Pseudobutyrivibrio xylanivorans TaxID=185007 RepID=A0A1G5S2T1_PSEXY|nr:hypothetical protein [Pseudobutyrivibrio xylanivorans]SCZ80160.1 hypothetical protein SAMN02910350_02154 [Pseudobutyrivibrio xylanivorans]